MRAKVEQASACLVLIFGTLAEIKRKQTEEPVCGDSEVRTSAAEAALILQVLCRG
jgi:hypothetical protein